MKCSSGSVDFGFEELKEFTYYIPNDSESTYTNQTKGTIEDCRKSCIDSNCLALNFKSGRCNLLFRYRYPRTRWFDYRGDNYNPDKSSHRLCFKGINVLKRYNGT
jgi:hypothetical protein